MAMGNEATATRSFRMGRKGDQPVVGDFNGDGTDEIGVYRNGTWYIDINRDHVIDDKDLVPQLGSADDIPVVGDWNGDGSDEVGVFHQGKLERPVTQNNRERSSGCEHFPKELDSQSSALQFQNWHSASSPPENTGQFVRACAVCAIFPDDKSSFVRFDNRFPAP